MGRSSQWWDSWFVNLARQISTASKDPSTKVGAVVVRPDRTIVSAGYNGFPRGVEDMTHRLENRDVKHAMVVHAEANAIVTAREPLHGHTIYCTHVTCQECAKLVIQAGIRRVIAPATGDLKDSWGPSVATARVMYAEAGIEFQMIDTETQQYATR